MKTKEIIVESNSNIDPRATSQRIRAIQAELKTPLSSDQRGALRSELKKLVGDMQTWQRSQPTKGGMIPGLETTGGTTLGKNELSGQFDKYKTGSENPFKKPYKQPSKPTNLPPGVTIKESTDQRSQSTKQISEAVDESWVHAYQALEANGGEPTPNKPTLFVKQLAMLAKDAGINRINLTTFIGQYIPKNANGYTDQRVYELATLVGQALSQAPSITDMKKYSQQSQAQTQQFTQQQAMGALQHDLSMQDLIRKNKLDQADAEAMLAMDIEARQAIKERQQQMELESKERLAQVEIDIRNSKEPEAERAQALEMAKLNNAHELQVIQITAEGEYKKAKLEADYQIQIKQLENIDNAEERQNKLDVINTNKAKEIGIINAETQAKIRGLQAETDAERASSDIRVQEAFMMTFKPIWGSLIQQASQLGRTLSQSISAVTGALSRLGKPVMPQAQKPANEDINRLKKLAGR